MDFLHLVSKLIHILCGVIVLVTGLLQLILPKRGAIHRRIGRVYFWFMMVVIVTAMPPAVYYGSWFLACVDLFAFYLLITGRRYGRNTQNVMTHGADKLITLFGFLCGLGMFFLAYMFFLKDAQGMMIPPIVFGALLILFSYQDYQFFFLRRPTRYGVLNWKFVHLSRMIGSYIGAVTAFLVNVAPFGNHWINWILPTIVGAVAISFFTRIYIRRHGLTNARVKG